MLMIASTSEQGLYKSRWEKYFDQWGRERKSRVITNELNEDTFWVKWTGEMVNKTIIRRALKRVKEVLPELTDSIYAFEQDDYSEHEACEEPTVIEIPVETVNVNFNKLTSEQKSDCQEVYDMYKANPKLAEDKFAEIKQMIEEGEPAQEIINKEYASLCALKCSKTKWSEIGGYFDAKSKT